MKDLPAQRRQNGYDNLDFRFGEYGVMFDGSCMARVPLPAYGIARIVTGQFVPVAGGGFNHLWDGEFPVNGAE